MKFITWEHHHLDRHCFLYTDNCEEQIKQSRTSQHDQAEAIVYYILLSGQTRQ